MNRGFYSAVSGLSAARTGLAVTGHNMSNTGTVGYVRQQALQHDFTYQGVGSNLQVGLGNDITMIRQIRDKYLDMSYRAEVGRAAFHSVIYSTGNELENIYGELQSQYSTQSITQDLWDSINELVMHPAGVESRSNFISTVTSYITKINNINERMNKEQMNLNNSIKEAVARVNQLTTRINELNGIIPLMEASGQRANDFRDERNLCLDELSRLINIDYAENYKGEVVVTTGGSELVCNGNAMQIGFRYTGPGSSLVEPVFTEKNYILDFDPTYQNAKPLFDYKPVGLKYANDNGEIFGMIVARGLYPTNYESLQWTDFAGKDALVGALPVIASPGTGTLPTIPTTPRPDYTLYTKGVKDQAYIDDYKNYLDGINTYIDEVESYLAAYGHDAGGDLSIPLADYNAAVTALAAFKADVTGTGSPAVSLADMNKQFTNFMNYHKYAEFNATQCMIPSTQRQMDLLFNYITNLVNDTLDGYGLSDDPYISPALGVPIFTEIIPGGGLTMGNVQINPELLEPGGHNKIGLADTDLSGRDDSTKATELLDLWKAAADIFEPGDSAYKMNIEEGYRFVINSLATKTNQSMTFYQVQTDLVNEIDNKRLRISGVSLDEELSNMMIYQHAFNASARMVSIIDSMIDRVINGTGRVGL